MGLKGKFTWQTLVVIVLFQGAVLAAFFFMAQSVLHGMSAWTSPFVGDGAPSLPDQAAKAFGRVHSLTTQAQKMLPQVVFGIGGAGLVLTWIGVLALGRAVIGQAERISEIPEAPTRPKESAEKTDEDALPEGLDPKNVRAVQILSILQRQGRFIDFLHEDLSPYDDAQIGAAVRSIHESCKKALDEYVELEAVRQEEEGSEVTIYAGFDASEIRLTGEVSGEPPFRGVLRHRGWRVKKIRLPRITAHVANEKIIAPAEVEVGGED